MLMKGTMPDEIKKLLRDRPELKRWFDSTTGRYNVPRVKVRSQKAQERALSRLSKSSATSSLGISGDFEVVSESGNDKAILDTLNSRGQIIKGGNLHTQKRLGISKGGRDARVLHDAIKTSVQQIRAMRNETHSHAHSVSLIEKDEQDTARAIDELKEKTLAMDTTIWQKQTLIDVRLECKFRSNLLNKLVNQGRKKQLMYNKLEKEADEHVHEANIMEHNTSDGVHGIDADLISIKNRLKETKNLALIRSNYSKVLAHVQSRTHKALQNAPVRQNFLNESTKAYADEVRQAKSMLEESIHQSDAEHKEITELVGHVKKLESAQHYKLGNLDQLSIQEKLRRENMLKKEQERKEFARDLVEMTQTERDSTIQNMMDGKTQSLEKKKKNLTNLLNENQSLIIAFEEIEQITSATGDRLVSKFLNRNIELKKLTSKRDTLLQTLDRKRAEERAIQNSLNAIHIQNELKKSNGMNSQKSRKKKETLESILFPLLRNVELKKNELENRITQLQSIVATCHRIADACNEANGKQTQRATIILPTTQEQENENKNDEDEKTILDLEDSKKRKKTKPRKPYKGKVMSVTKVHELIASIYEKKVKADDIDDQQNNERDSLINFTKEMFKQTYGTSLAVSKMREFRGSIEIHLSSSKVTPTYRIRWFNTMVGWDLTNTQHVSDSQQYISTPYHSEAIDAFLQILQEVIPMDLIEEKMDDNPCMVSIEQTLRACGTDGNGIFDINWRTTSSFTNMVSALRKNDFQISPKKKKKIQPDALINLDHMMNVVMRQWYIWRVDQTEPLAVQLETKIETETVLEEIQEWSFFHLKIDSTFIQPLLTRSCQLVRTLITKLSRGKHDELFGAALYQELDGFNTGTLQAMPRVSATHTKECHTKPNLELQQQSSKSSTRPSSRLSSTRPSRPESSASVISHVSFALDDKNADDNTSFTNDDNDEEGIGWNDNNIHDDEDFNSDNDNDATKTNNNNISIEQSLINSGRAKNKDSNAPKSRSELKLIATLVSSGKVRHVPKTTRKHTARDNAVKDQQDNAKNKGRKKKDGTNSQNNNTKNIMVFNEKQGTRRRGSLMDRLNHQRVMSQHAELKHLVMDMSAARKKNKTNTHSASTKKNKRYGEKKIKKQNTIGRTGLHIAKAPRRKNGAGTCSAGGDKRKTNTTPKTKFMKVAHLKQAYGN